MVALRRSSLWSYAVFNIVAGLKREWVESYLTRSRQCSIDIRLKIGSFKGMHGILEWMNPRQGDESDEDDKYESLEYYAIKDAMPILSGGAPRLVTIEFRNILLHIHATFRIGRPFHF